MKARIYLLITLITLIFASCKKTVTDKAVTDEIKVPELLKQEVINYVLSKRVKGDKDLNSAIDTILSQVNWSNYKIVYNEAGQKLTIIELNSFSENKLMMLLYTNKGRTGYNGLQLVTAKKQPTSGTSEMDAIALLHQVKDITYSGSISYFKLSKQFLYEVGYENGVRKYFRTLGNKNNSVSAQVTTEACYEVYLVTYWNDGSTTYDYMYSYCDSGGGDNGDCHQQRLLNFNTASAGNGLRCGPWSGGGGGEGPTIIEEQINISEDEQQYADEDYLLSGYAPIRYNYHATVLRETSGNTIIELIMDPITASPMYGNYVDRYNRNVTRTLTLFNHINNYILLTPTSVSLNWSCAVIGRYTYTNGNPTFTRQWNVTKSAVN